MDSINVLILSAGRRVELVNCFKNAAKELDINSRIIAADLSNMAPAIYFADKYYHIPRIGTDNYLNEIINICNKENIKLIVPTIDTELLILAKNKEYIESKTNAKLLVSDLSVIEICRNKINSQKFFEENHFGVPKMINDIHSNNFDFPVFIKPLDGSSSINAFKVNNQEELEFFYSYIKNPIVQEMMVGIEYTVDVFLDYNSQIITIAPRQRIATRSGEIAKGKIIKDREIINDVARLMKVLKPIGHITVQCMKTSRGIQYIEINPRFGGGAPMTIKAGANSCKNLYKLLQGETLTYNEDYRDNVFFLRFDDAIMLDKNMEITND